MRHPHGNASGRVAHILFYLVRPGTNIRAITKDKSPVLAHEHALDAALQYFDRLVPCQDLGPLEAVRVDDYYQAWRLPELRAENTIREQAVRA